MSFISNFVSGSNISFVRKLGLCATKFSDKGSLMRNDLIDLLSGKINCLVVEGFLQKKGLETEQRLMAGYHNGLLNLPADRVFYGISCEDADKNSNLRFYYHNSATKGLKKLREDADHNTMWFDKLRLDLDAEYDHGTLMECPIGPKRQAFIARAYDTTKKPLIQTREIPESFRPKFLKTHLVAMQFLVAPEKGGVLQFYPGLFDKAEKQAFSEGRISVFPGSLPAPAQEIKPYAGRLVLFNADMPFRFTQVESRELTKEESNSKEKVIKDISLVVEETYILQKGESQPLCLMR